MPGVKRKGLQHEARCCVTEPGKPRPSPRPHARTGVHTTAGVCKSEDNLWNSSVLPARGFPGSSSQALYPRQLPGPHIPQQADTHAVKHKLPLMNHWSIRIPDSHFQTKGALFTEDTSAWVSSIGLKDKWNNIWLWLSSKPDLSSSEDYRQFICPSNQLWNCVCLAFWGFPLFSVLWPGPPHQCHPPANIRGGGFCFCWWCFLCSASFCF